MPFLDSSRVAPDGAAVTRALAAAERRGPVVPLRTADAVQREREARSPTPVPDATECTIAGVAGPISVRVITPAGPVRALRVTAHASGWCLGTPVLDDALDALLAASGLATASIGYRLAPEHPHPAGLHDVEAGLRWALGDGSRELRTDRVLAAGASAGAHLMLLAALRLRRDHPDRLARLRALDLRYGCYDLGRSPSLRAAGSGDLITTDAGTRALLDHLLPGVDDELRRDPSLSPLYAELDGLPPTLVAVGDGDGLLDDSTFLAARLAAAGVTTELQVWAGCPHVFDTLSPPLAVEYARRLMRWLETSGALAPDPAGVADPASLDTAHPNEGAAP